MFVVCANISVTFVSFISYDFNETFLSIEHLDTFVHSAILGTTKKSHCFELKQITLRPVIPNLFINADAEPCKMFYVSFCYCCEGGALNITSCINPMMK